MYFKSFLCVFSCCLHFWSFNLILIRFLALFLHLLTRYWFKKAPENLMHLRECIYWRRNTPVCFKMQVNQDKSRIQFNYMYGWHCIAPLSRWKYLTMLLCFYCIFFNDGKLCMLLFYFRRIKDYVDCRGIASNRSNRQLPFISGANRLNYDK